MFTFTVLWKSVILSARPALFAAALILIGSPLWAGEADPGSQTAPILDAESQEVLAGYFDALKSGDLALLGKVIGGDLRVRRAGLLGNPEYSDTLIRIFGNAQFVLVNYLVPSENLHIAVFDCWFTDAERSRYHLTLQRASSNEQLKITNVRVQP